MAPQALLPSLSPSHLVTPPPETTKTKTFSRSKHGLPKEESAPICYSHWATETLSAS